MQVTTARDILATMRALDTLGVPEEATPRQAARVLIQLGPLPPAFQIVAACRYRQRRHEATRKEGR